MTNYTMKRIGTEAITVDGYDYDWPVTGLFKAGVMVASELGYGDHLMAIRDRGYILNNIDRVYPAKDHIRWVA